MSRLLCVFICLCVVLLAGCAPRPVLIGKPTPVPDYSGPSRDFRVTYKVTGDAAKVYVTYLDTFGDVRQEWITLPWEHTELFAYGAATSVKATKDAFLGWGNVACVLELETAPIRQDQAGFGKHSAECDVWLKTD